MMKKCFLFLLAAWPGWLCAQVTVSVQLPPGGMIQKDQLWNLVAVNNNAASLDAVLLLSLQEVTTGQTVLTAATRGVILPSGVKMLKAQDLQPIQYNYSGSGFDGLYIPLGSYTACYTISRTTAESQEPVVTECVRINITPLSPPLLSQPANQSSVLSPYPQFSWVPPAPLDMFTELSYDLNVVELLEGQSPAEAISNNSPVYTRGFLQLPFENYASSYAGLETGKTYAWQVTARNGLNYAAATEVWTFRLGGDSVAAALANKNYIQLKNSGSGSSLHQIRSGVLRVKYYSYSGQHAGEFRFYDQEQNLLKRIKKDIQYGDNFFLFELDRDFQKKKLYRLELTDQNAQTTSISFIIQE